MTINHMAALLLVPGLIATRLFAAVEVLPERPAQSVFSGGERAVVVRLRNTGGSEVKVALRSSIGQAASATIAPLGSGAGTDCVIGPHQTVIETVKQDLPEVRGRTHFVVQWFDGTNRLAGTTEVYVYAQGLLRPLTTLAGEQALGVCEPDGQFARVLRASGLEIEQVDDAGLEHFDGRLAIVRGFAARDERAPHLRKVIQAAAGRGVAIVWLAPSEAQTRETKLKPSFYVVPAGRGNVVVAEPQLADGLEENPQSQLNLVELAKTAIQPRVMELPR